MKDIKKQLKNAYEVLNTAEYYKVDNLTVDKAGSDIVFEFTTAKGWNAHINVHSDGSIYMEYSAYKTEDNENIQKRTTYCWTIPENAKMFSILDQWVYWTEIDMNGVETRKEVVIC